MTQGPIEERLIELDAPRNVRDAGKTIDRYSASSLPPPKDVVDYIKNWLNHERGNNRYGR